MRNVLETKKCVGRIRITFIVLMAVVIIKIIFKLLPCGLKEVKCRAMKCLAREDGNYLRRTNYLRRRNYPNYLTAAALESLLHFKAFMSGVSFYTRLLLCLSLSLDDQ